MPGDVVYLFTPMAHSPEDMPNRIRFLRKQRGLTLQQVADEIGVHKTMMGMLERGDRPLHLTYQQAIARVLGVAPADLLRTEDNPFSGIAEEDRKFFLEYLSFDAAGRRTLRSLSENLREWRGDSPDADTDRKTG